MVGVRMREGHARARSVACVAVSVIFSQLSQKPPQTRQPRQTRGPARTAPQDSSAHKQQLAKSSSHNGAFNPTRVPSRELGDSKHLSLAARGPLRLARDAIEKPKGVQTTHNLASVSGAAASEKHGGTNENRQQMVFFSPNTQTNQPGKPACSLTLRAIFKIPEDGDMGGIVKGCCAKILLPSSKSKP
jgi:hypothetical protein